MQTLSHRTRQAVCAFGFVAAVLAASPAAQAAPVISRLTPPSALFTFGDSSAPYTSRFLSRQRFDLQVTVRPDTDQTITAAKFFVAGNYLITGQVPGTSAAHTASDIPLSAFGLGSSMFSGVMDNTDVFFKVMQAALGGTRIKAETMW